MKTIAESTGHEKRALQALLTGIVLALLLVGAARAEYGYSYFRTVDGSASLQSAEDGEWLEALENHPLIAGDYLQVGSSSRIEVVLADGGLLRLSGGSEVSFDSLAWTQDTDATVTRLYLSRGAVQVVLGDDVEGYEPLEIETREATLYFRAPGAYRLEALDGGGLELVVRDGFAEARTDEGLTIVRAGEMASLGSLGRRRADGRSRLRLAGALGRGSGRRGTPRRSALRGARTTLQSRSDGDARQLGRRQRALGLATLRQRGLAPLHGGLVGLHAQRHHLGLERALGLDPIALRKLGPRGRGRLGLVRGEPLLPGERLLVLGTDPRGLGAGGLLHLLLQRLRRLRLRSALRRVRLGWR